jgi:hypothetical protein
MTSRFDVFQFRSSGSVRGLGAFDTIQQARACVTQNSGENPEVRHVINDIGTGTRHAFPEEQQPSSSPNPDQRSPRFVRIPIGRRSDWKKKKNQGRAIGSSRSG